MATTATQNDSYYSKKQVQESLVAAVRTSLHKNNSHNTFNCDGQDANGANMLLSMLERPVAFQKSKAQNLDEEIKAKIQASKTSLVLTSSDKQLSAKSANQLLLQDHLCHESDLIEWSKHKLYGAIRFRNHGNSCYLNAVLQCILATTPFVGFCERIHKEPNKCLVTSRGKFCNLCEIARLLKAQQIGNQTIISPLRFLNNIKSIMASLSYDSQEDAHEYFLGVLAQMEENYLTAMGGNVPLKMRDTNPIRKIFGGVTRSTVVCQTCYKVSNRDEHMFNLSLDITKADNIQHCLQNSTLVEHLKGSNAYKCEPCKQLRHAKRHVTVHSPPRILVIQLNRFTRFHKIDRSVSFSISLNLRPYMTESNGPSVMYELYATVNHRGHSCRSGHYIAYTRRHNQWQCLNDDMVHGVSTMEVLRSQPYLLYYQRVDTSTMSSQHQTSGPNNVRSILKAAEHNKPMGISGQGPQSLPIGPQQLPSSKSTTLRLLVASNSQSTSGTCADSARGSNGVPRSPTTKFWLLPAQQQRVSSGSSPLKPDQQQRKTSLTNPELGKHLTTPSVSKWEEDAQLSPTKILKRPLNEVPGNGHSHGEPLAKVARFESSTDSTQQQNHKPLTVISQSRAASNGDSWSSQCHFSPPTLPPGNHNHRHSNGFHQRGRGGQHGHHSNYHHNHQPMQFHSRGRGGHNYHQQRGGGSGNFYHHGNNHHHNNKHGNRGGRNRWHAGGNRNWRPGHR